MNKVVFGQTKVVTQPPVENEDCIIVDGSDGELGITGSAKLAHGADPQR